MAERRECRDGTNRLRSVEKIFTKRFARRSEFASLLPVFRRQGFSTLCQQDMGIFFLAKDCERGVGTEGYTRRTTLGVKVMSPHSFSAFS